MNDWTFPLFLAHAEDAWLHLFTALLPVAVIMLVLRWIKRTAPR